jgi:hypothetical protein
MEAYISARGRATAITVLMILQLAALSLSTVMYLVALGDVSSHGEIIVAGGSLEILDGLLYLATFIVFMTWVYRSIANLPALGSMSCRFTPSGAVWSYIIPIVNAVRGHQVMATIWTESQPPAVNENGFYLPRKTTIVNLWWGMMVLLTISSRVTARMNPIGYDELRSLLTMNVGENVIYIIAGSLFLFMVRGAQSRQDEQWQDLVRRQNVPQPTADALR